MTADAWAPGDPLYQPWGGVSRRAMVSLISDWHQHNCGCLVGAPFPDAADSTHVEPDIVDDAFFPGLRTRG